MGPRVRRDLVTVIVGIFDPVDRLGVVDAGILMCQNLVQDVHGLGLDSNVQLLPSEVGYVNNAGQRQ